VQIDLLLHQIEDALRQKLIVLEAGSKLGYVLTAEFKPGIAANAIAQGVLDLHAIAEDVFALSICDLLACEKIENLGFALPPAFQLQLVKSFLNFDFALVVGLRRLLVDEPKVLVVNFLRNGMLVVAVGHVHLLESFYRGNVRYFGCLQSRPFPPLATRRFLCFFRLLELRISLPLLHLSLLGLSSFLLFLLLSLPLPPLCLYSFILLPLLLLLFDSHPFFRLPLFILLSLLFLFIEPFSFRRLQVLFGHKP
jgi:hypothetical protein